MESGSDTIIGALIGRILRTFPPATTPCATSNAGSQHYKWDAVRIFTLDVWCRVYLTILTLDALTHEGLVEHGLVCIGVWRMVIQVLVLAPTEAATFLLAYIGYSIRTTLPV